MLGKVAELETVRYRKQTHDSMKNTVRRVDDALQSNRLECFEAIALQKKNLESHEQRVDASLRETSRDVKDTIESAVRLATLKSTDDIGVLKAAVDDVVKRNNELETRGTRRDEDIAALRTTCESETQRLEQLISGRAEEVVALKNTVWERLDANVNAVQNADERIEELRQHQTKLQADVVGTQSALEVVRNDILQHQQALEHSEKQAVKTAEEIILTAVNELRTEVSGQVASAAEERNSLKTSLMNLEEKNSSFESDLNQKESSLVQINVNIEDTKKQFDLVKELVQTIENEVENNGEKMKEIEANSEKISSLERTVQMLETKTANVSSFSLSPIVLTHDRSAEG